VAFGSTKTDNVITYTTWLEVDNSDLSLRPGMTAAPPSSRRAQRRAAGAQHGAALHAGSGGGAAAPAASGHHVELMPRMPARSRAGAGPQPARQHGRSRAPGLGAAGRPAVAVQ
jgi:HlyD family secretion protein